VVSGACETPWRDQQTGEQEEMDGEAEWMTDQEEKEPRGHENGRADQAPRVTRVGGHDRDDIEDLEASEAAPSSAPVSTKRSEW
jgi:hypothetical protein